MPNPFYFDELENDQNVRNQAYDTLFSSNLQSAKASFDEAVKGISSYAGILSSSRVAAQDPDILENAYKLKPGSLSRKNLLSVQDLNARYSLNGAIKFDKPITQDAAETIYKNALANQERTSIIERNKGVVGELGNFAAGTVGSLVDPIGIATSLIALPESLGARTLGILGSRLLVGAAEGALGNLALEPVNYYNAQILRQNYTLADTINNLAYGAVLGASFNAGIGFVSDAVDNQIQRRNLARDSKKLTPDIHTKAVEASLSQAVLGQDVDVLTIISNEEKLRKTNLEKEAVDTIDELQTNEISNKIYDGTTTVDEVLTLQKSGVISNQVVKNLENLGILNEATVNEQNATVTKPVKNVTGESVLLEKTTNGQEDVNATGATALLEEASQQTIDTPNATGAEALLEPVENTNNEQKLPTTEQELPTNEQEQQQLPQEKPKTPGLTEEQLAPEKLLAKEVKLLNRELSNLENEIVNITGLEATQDLIDNAVHFLSNEYNQNDLEGYINDVFFEGFNAYGDTVGQYNSLYSSLADNLVIDASFSEAKMKHDIIANILTPVLANIGKNIWLKTPLNTLSESEIVKFLDLDSEGSDIFNEVYGKVIDTITVTSKLLLEQFDNLPSKSEAKKNFKSWFKKSKAVDDNGKPLVLYHGTQQEFNRFRLTSKHDGDGHYFSSKPTVSESYISKVVTGEDLTQSLKYKNNGKVLPVFLSLQNPLIIDANNSNWDKIQFPKDLYLELYPNDELEYSPDTDKGDYLLLSTRQIYSIVDGNDKYDGVIIKNVYDVAAGFIDVTDTLSDVYIAKNGNQIKSVYNQGFFDAENPDIRKQDIRGSVAKNPELAMSYFIELTENADISTPLHEMAHIYFEYLSPEEKDTVVKWAEKQKKFNTPELEGLARYEEIFAYGFEKYLLEEKTKNQILDIANAANPDYVEENEAIFGQFRKLLQNVIESLKEFIGYDKIKLNNDIRRIYSLMLSVNTKFTEPTLIDTKYNTLKQTITNYIDTNERLQHKNMLLDLEKRKNKDLKEQALKAEAIEKFKKAYPDTAVVDINGDPKVLYHGTNFNFKNIKKGEAEAAWFTDNLSQARQWVSDSDGDVFPESKAYTALSSAKKLYEINVEPTNDETVNSTFSMGISKQLAKQLDLLNLDDEDENGNIVVSSKEVVAKVINMGGYDGVVFKNIHMNFFNGVASNIYAIFDTTSIHKIGTHEFYKNKYNKAKYAFEDNKITTDEQLQAEHETLYNKQLTSDVLEDNASVDAINNSVSNIDNLQSSVDELTDVEWVEKWVVENLDENKQQEYNEIVTSFDDSIVEATNFGNVLRQAAACLIQKGN